MVLEKNSLRNWKMQYIGERLGFFEEITTNRGSKGKERSESRGHVQEVQASPGLSSILAGQEDEA